MARTGPIDSDEFGFLAQTASHWFPMHHTLFMTAAACWGSSVATLIEASSSSTSSRARRGRERVVDAPRSWSTPATAAAAAIMLGVGPVFWGYGAMAGNYTAIVLVGSFLLGIAYRGRSQSEEPGIRSPRASRWPSERAIVRTSARSGCRCSP